jgi:hypothetical protein
MSFSSFKSFGNQVAIPKLFKKLLMVNEILVNESFEFPNSLSNGQPLYRELSEEEKKAFVWFSAGNYQGTAGCRIVSSTNYFPPFVDGTQAIDIQLTSYIEQTIYLGIGTYIFSTYYVSFNGVENNPIQVSINGQVLTTIRKLVNNWTLFTHTFNILKAENKLLRLEGLNAQPEFENSRTGIDLVALSKNDGPMNSDYQNFLANKPPYAYFRATDFIEGTGKIPAKIGDFIADTSGVTLDNGAGNGATADIPFLFGNTTQKINFNVTIPDTFTICSITRYSSNNRGTILNTLNNGYFIHGHWKGNRGVAHYNNWITKENPSLTNEGNGLMTDWLVMCGKNDSIQPTNILADNNKVGKLNGGVGGQKFLNINGHEPSDFEFNQLLIWDKVLTDDEMQKVSNYLTQYLKDGLD